MAVKRTPKATANARATRQGTTRQRATVATKSPAAATAPAPPAHQPDTDGQQRAYQIWRDRQYARGRWSELTLGSWDGCTL